MAAASRNVFFFSKDAGADLFSGKCSGDKGDRFSLNAFRDTPAVRAKACDAERHVFHSCSPSASGDGIVIPGWLIRIGGQQQYPEPDSVGMTRRCLFPGCPHIRRRSGWPYGRPHRTFRTAKKPLLFAEKGIKACVRKIGGGRAMRVSSAGGAHPVVQVGGLSRTRCRHPERKKSVFSGFWLFLGVSKGLTFHMKRGKRFSLSGGIFIMYAIMRPVESSTALRKAPRFSSKSSLLKLAPK